MLQEDAVTEFDQRLATDPLSQKIEELKIIFGHWATGDHKPLSQLARSFFSASDSIEATNRRFNNTLLSLQHRRFGAQLRLASTLARQITPNGDETENLKFTLAVAHHYDAAMALHRQLKHSDIALDTTAIKAEIESIKAQLNGSTVPTPLSAEGLSQTFPQIQMVIAETLLDEIRCRMAFAGALYAFPLAETHIQAATMMGSAETEFRKLDFMHTQNTALVVVGEIIAHKAAQPPRPQA